MNIIKHAHASTNNAVGTIIALAAIEAIAHRQANESAITILDRICGAYRDSDVCFEIENPPDRPHPDCRNWTQPYASSALGMLLLETFAPKGVSDMVRYSPMLLWNGGGHGEAEIDTWCDEVLEPFTKRYGF